MRWGAGMVPPMGQGLYAGPVPTLRQGVRMPAGTPLPEGLVVFVKRECPTCELVVPVLAELRERAGLTVIVQDDPGFPAGLAPRHDADLALSWHARIEAVPTLLRV